MRKIAFVLCALLWTAGATQCQIQPEFFAMGVALTADMPKVSYGTLAHPPVGWTTIEGARRGAYNFKGMDQFVKNSRKDANGIARVHSKVLCDPALPDLWLLENSSVLILPLSTGA